MPSVTDFLAVLGAIGTLYGATIKLLSVLGRRRQMNVQAEVRNIQLVLQERAEMLDDCRQQCERCKADLQREQNERIGERDFFFRQLTEANRRLSDCEGILHRMGWKEQRKKPRGRASGGESA